MGKLSALSTETTFNTTDFLVKVKAAGGGDVLVTLANLLLAAAPAWASWTPTLTNLSGGTLNYAKYMQIGKLVFFRFKYTLAGTGVAGDVTFTLPATMNSDYTQDTPVQGDAAILRAGTQGYVGFLRVNTTTSMGIRPIATPSGGNATYGAGLSATNPLTFASGDILFAAGVYEAA